MDQSEFSHVPFLKNIFPKDQIFDKKLRLKFQISEVIAGIFLDCLRLNVKDEDPCPNCVSQWIQNMEIMYSCTCFEPLFLKSVKSKLFALPAMVI